MLSTIGAKPELTSQNGRATGRGSWVQPKVYSAKVAANLGEVQALRLCLSYQSRGRSSPSLSPVGQVENEGNNTPLWERVAIE